MDIRLISPMSVFLRIIHFLLSSLFPAFALAGTKCPLLLRLKGALSLLASKLAQAPQLPERDLSIHETLASQFVSN